MEHIFHWIMVFASIAMLLGVMVLEVMAVLFVSKKLAGEPRNIGGGGRGGGPHPLPATGTMENSRGAANPKESRPIGSRDRGK